MCDSGHEQKFLQISEAYQSWFDELRQKELEETRQRKKREKWEHEGRWSVVEHGGCVGLTNVRNTCWMNSVVQSLAHVEPFVAKFLCREEMPPVLQNSSDDDVDDDAGEQPKFSAMVRSQSPDTPPSPGDFRRQCTPPKVSLAALPFGSGELNHHKRQEAVIAKGLQLLLQELWQEEQRKAVNPWKFNHCLTRDATFAVKKAFQAAQDAQEFMLFIMNALHEELDQQPYVPARHAHLKPRSSKASPSRPASVPEGAAVSDHRTDGGRCVGRCLTSKRLGPIAGCFQGRLQSELKCDTCGFSSASQEEFFHLSVTVRDAYELSLQEVLAQEFAEERLEGDNRWRCEECNALVDATKRLTLQRLPPVIVLHLKRFGYMLSGDVRKVRTSITLENEGSDGLDGLDLSRYADAPPGTAVYDIVSIINHHGRDAACGHYTAHCRHCVDGQWYSFNDEVVAPIETSEVWLPGEAYMVCLARRDPDRTASP